MQYGLYEEMKKLYDKTAQGGQVRIADTLWD